MLAWLAPRLPAEQPVATASAVAVLHAARTLAGEGYERRATIVEHSLPAGESVDLPIFLLLQNTYCFLLASSETDDALSFAVCDDDGNVVADGSYLPLKKNLHLFYLQPDLSGRHRLRIVNLGDAAARVSLTYCYR
jgi:hypothetical protein